MDVPADAVVAKYLARYAVAEIAAAGRIQGPYAHVCAIPAMDESADLIDGLRGVEVAGPGPWLAIVVVNATDAAAPAVHARNAALLAGLCTRGAAPAERIADAPGMWLVRDALPGMDLCVVDRASPGWRFPADQGVGLARRIGCDLALALYAAGALRTRWIHMTDADVTLPADYFAAAARVGSDSVALTYGFWHGSSPAGDAWVDAAAGLYEVYLRYHRLGLSWAGSPYALHTIGSSLAVDARAYAAVRGVPRRQAAEDFYLVNKLVKLGAVREPAGAPIAIRARRSARVPFGTGAATGTIAGALSAGSVYRVYHPRVYALLGAWLEAMKAFAAAGGHADEGVLDHALAGSAVTWKLAEEERRALDHALASLDARQALLDARTRARTPAALSRRLHDWFDGFRTLKLVHAVRDAGLPSLPWAEALRQAPFLAGVSVPADIDARDVHDAPELHDVHDVRDAAALAEALLPVRHALVACERAAVTRARTARS